jgi:hypothetical protein
MVRVSAGPKGPLVAERVGRTGFPEPVERPEPDDRDPLPFEPAAGAAAVRGAWLACSRRAASVSRWALF